MSAANTWDCFRETLGRRIVAVVKTSRHTGESRTLRWLVFDDGSALVLCDNGTYWRASVDETQTVMAAERLRLKQCVEELGDALKADGLSTTPPAGGEKP